MYEYIEGAVADLTPTYAVIDTGGVGYMINISLQTFTAVSSQSRTRLYTHYVVREDAQLLYGFASREERELFRLLIGVSGVGGNTARMILSTFKSDELSSIIYNEQAQMLKTVKGLGLKTAQKIIVELKDKVIAVALAQQSDHGAVANSAVMDEGLDALKMLGFTKAASEKVLREIVKESPNISVEDAIRTALKRL
ncbi:MAG: Holliday junction branch migration protein RuvA [Rikenellaceae bacterium]|nr:Holliday junction branch migration protein RuvA [Rikenellaceae bacterium]